MRRPVVLSLLLSSLLAGGAVAGSGGEASADTSPFSLTASAVTVASGDPLTLTGQAAGGEAGRKAVAQVLRTVPGGRWPRARSAAGEG